MNILIERSAGLPDWINYNPISDVISEVYRKALEINGIPVDTPGIQLSKEQAESIRNYMHTNEEWQWEAQRLLNITFSDSYKVGEVTKDIYVPWWDEMALASKTPPFLTESGIQMEACPMHSYAIQLIRRRPGISGDCKPVSVFGFTVTQDRQLVLGKRGGHHAADTLMTIAAGTCTWYQNPFQAMESETKEELCITTLRLDHTSRRLISVFEVDSLYGFCFVVEPSDTFATIQYLWSYQTGKEHTKILGIKLSVEELRQIISIHGPAGDNYLYYMALPVLLSGGNYFFGPGWLPKAEELLASHQ